MLIQPGQLLRDSHVIFQPRPSFQSTQDHSQRDHQERLSKRSLVFSSTSQLTYNNKVTELVVTESVLEEVNDVA